MSRLAVSFSGSDRQELGSARALERQASRNRWLPESLFLAASVIVLASYLLLTLPRMTGDTLLSGRFFLLLEGLALFGLLGWSAAQQKCGAAVAAGLAVLVVLTEPGLVALTTVGDDLLPLVLQLAALVLVAQDLTRRRLALAALACGMAVLAKLSAVWAPLAIAWWTYRRQRPLIRMFVGCWLCWTLGSFLLLDSFAPGRMLSRLLVPSVWTLDGLAVLQAPFRLVWRSAQGGPLLTVLLPLVATEAILAWRQERLTVYHTALGACLLTTLAGCFDKEASNDSLLGLIVLSVPVLACLWSRLTDVPGEAAVLQPVLALLLLWAMYVGWLGTLVVAAGRQPSGCGSPEGWRPAASPCHPVVAAGRQPSGCGSPEGLRPTASDRLDPRVGKTVCLETLHSQRISPQANRPGFPAGSEMNKDGHALPGPPR